MVADAHRARVADALLEGGARRDELAIHVDSLAAVEVLRAIDDWQCAHAAAAVSGRIEGALGDETHRFEWASVSKLATALAALVVPRGDRRSGRACRPAGRDVSPPARSRIGPALRSRSAHLTTGSPAHLHELRLRGRRSTRRRARGDGVPCVLRTRVGGHGHAARRLGCLRVSVRSPTSPHSRATPAPQRVAAETLAEAVHRSVPWPRRGSARLRAPAAE